MRSSRRPVASNELSRSSSSATPSPSRTATAFPTPTLSSSNERRYKRRQMQKTLTLVMGLALCAGLAFAQDPPTQRGDLTDADLARVRAVTVPTTDFSHAENFEQMQAGAATVRKRVNGDIFSFSQANLSFEQEEQFKLG